MTNQEINEKLARLDGIFISEDIFRRGSIKVNVKSFPHLMPDYCKDLNLLMPLAWKYKLDINHVGDELQACYFTMVNGEFEAFPFKDKDPKQAIIQCLLKIAEEG